MATATATETEAKAMDSGAVLVLAQIDNGADVDLPTLAGAIVDAHEQCASAMRDGLQHALVAGRLLQEAKARVEHGHWLAWLDENCGFSRRLAQMYTSLASAWHLVEAEAGEQVSQLTFREALRLTGRATRALAALPEPARERAVLMVEGGQAKNFGEASAVIRREAMAVEAAESMQGRSLTVEVEPSDAFLRRDELEAALLASRPDLAERQAAVDVLRERRSALDARRDELRAELERVEAELSSVEVDALTAEQELRGVLAREVEAAHGPLVPGQVVSWREADEDFLRRLDEAADEDERRALLMERAGLHACEQEQEPEPAGVEVVEGEVVAVHEPEV